MFASLMLLDIDIAAGRVLASHLHEDYDGIIAWLPLSLKVSSVPYST